MNNRLEAAIISKPQGIKGEVRVRPLVNDPKDLLDIDKLYTSDEGKEYYNINKAWQTKQMVCMKFDGIDTREDAELLRGLKLYIDKDMKSLQEDSYYLTDLIGCSLQDENGNELGILKDVLQNGSADVYVIEGKKNFMMPALKQVIMNVDIKKKAIIVNSIKLMESAVYEN